MLAYTYIEKGKFALVEKPKPELIEPTDAIVKVTLGSICTSDLHIKHGSVPRAVPGITVGHEMVGLVEQVGTEVTAVKPGDRVTVNVETFCGECFYCKNGFVNNCTSPHGGWALGCRIDGGQTEYVRVPLANQGLNRIPDGVTDEQALFVGDVLATGFWAARISEICKDDTVLIIGAGPTGICTLLCVMLDSKIVESTIAGKKMFNVADGFLLACFDKDVNDAVITDMAKLQPAYAVLRDSSYADDSTATNFEQIFKTYSPNTIIKAL